MSGTSRVTTVRPPWVEFLEGSLAQVEELMQSEIKSQVRAITNMSSRSLNVGGKRFRPALVILGALAVESNADVSRPVRLGVGVELLHLGTLLHDDVVDGADSRRGSASANALYGNKLSVLLGDYLLARSYSILARENDPQIINMIASVAVALSEGEVLELLMRGTLGELESLYWKMIDRKTARLISACLEMGAMAIGAKDKYVEALGSYGERIGLVFQITDDLLDVTGSRETLGKPVGADLMDGKVTLPYILALRDLPQENCDSLLEKILEGALHEEDLHFLTAQAAQPAVIDQCLALANEQVEMAIKHLSGLPATPAKSILEEIGPYLLSRTS